MRLEVSPGRYYLPPSGTFRQILSVPISSPLSATFRPSATSARQLPALRASATSARQQPPSPAIRHPISSVLPAALRPSATSARQLYPPPRISKPPPPPVSNLRPSATCPPHVSNLHPSGTPARQLPDFVSLTETWSGLLPTVRFYLSIYPSPPPPLLGSAPPPVSNLRPSGTLSGGDGGCRCFHYPFTCLSCICVSTLYKTYPCSRQILAGYRFPPVRYYLSQQPSALRYLGLGMDALTN